MVAENSINALSARLRGPEYNFKITLMQSISSLIFEILVLKSFVKLEAGA